MPYPVSTTIRAVRRRLRRVRRRLSSQVRPARAALVYHPDYQTDLGSLYDPERGQKIIDYLLAQGCLHHRSLYRPSSISVADLSLAHLQTYLSGVDQPETLASIFGTHQHDIDPHSVIRQQRRMVAGTVMATRLALARWRLQRPVVNLGGGLHHAQRARGGGFCVFNDVAVAIERARADGFTGRVLVVDLDLHHGDGTRDIFRDDKLVHTFSIHARDWDDTPAVADTSVALGTGVGDVAYMTAITAHLPVVLNQAQPDLVFYVAGVDPALDDELGSWRITHEGLSRRDRFVLDCVRGIPLVWVLAGGYGPEAWRHTARSLGWLLAHYDKVIPSRSDAELAAFRRIARRLQPADLTTERDQDELFSITEEDLFGDLTGRRIRTRLLNYYTDYGIEVALEQYGVLGHLRSLGYERFRVELDLDHSNGECVRLFSDDLREDLLIELVLKEEHRLSPHRLLSIEWLLLQNPRASASERRALWPGQEHPGLGCVREITGMLLMSCERLGFDGLSFSPSHYHIAAVARGLPMFPDPALEARILAVEAAVEGSNLSEATSLVHRGEVVDEAGKPVTWTGGLMVLPVTKQMKAHFDSSDYENAVKAEVSRLHYKLRGR